MFLVEEDLGGANDHAFDRGVEDNLPDYIDFPLWALKDVGLFTWGFGIVKRDMWRKPSDYYLKEVL